MAGASVFLACPLAHGQASWEMCMRAHQGVRPGSETRVTVRANQSSLLAYNFNTLWAEALNRRQELGLTHFAMLHSDVVPEPGWLDILLEEQALVGIDLLSCVIPIKDGRGLTSTAIVSPTNAIRRLTLWDLIEGFYANRSLPLLEQEGRLLVNTGCWVCDFTQPWVEKVSFQCQDKIVKNEEGRFVAHNVPEDWHFSMQCHRLGVSVAATRVVELAHLGEAEYRNDHVWGTWQTDEGGR